jgi:hypothetical protein
MRIYTLDATGSKDYPTAKAACAAKTFTGLSGRGYVVTYNRCAVCWLAAWLPGCLAGWLPGCLAGWLPGWLAGWLPGWLAGWLPGWLAGWLPGCLGLPGWLAAWLLVNMPSPPSASVCWGSPAAALEGSMDRRIHGIAVAAAPGGRRLLLRLLLALRGGAAAQTARVCRGWCRLLCINN